MFPKVETWWNLRRCKKPYTYHEHEKRLTLAHKEWVDIRIKGACGPVHAHL